MSFITNATNREKIVSLLKMPPDVLKVKPYKGQNINLD